jgi:histidinol phosphatase-like enzyme (inositol monophosphatase family)
MNERDVLSSLRDAVPFAESLADEARLHARRFFRTGSPVDIKADGSPVTRADLAIEMALRQSISVRFPDHSILGEESGGDITAGWSWALDPIDGTKSFICGVPLFGTLIALTHERRPALGVIEMPILGERWVGYGNTATWNGTPTIASSCSSLHDARLFATAPEMFNGTAAAAFETLGRHVSMRRFGTDCYAYGLLASGYCDLVVEAGLKVHDVLALAPVVRAAGGVISDWRGNPITADFDGRVVASATQELHSAALAVLSGK